MGLLPLVVIARNPEADASGSRLRRFRMTTMRSAADVLVDAEPAAEHLARLEAFGML